MKNHCCLLSLLLLTSAAAQAPVAKASADAPAAKPTASGPDVKASADAPDPLARLWEVDRIDDDLYRMAIDLPHFQHDDPADPAFLSVYLSVGTAAKKVHDIAIVVPAAADQPKGLAIGFVKVGKTIEVPADLARFLPLGDKDEDGYLIRIPPASSPPRATPNRSTSWAASCKTSS